MHFTHLPDLTHEIVYLRAIESRDIDDWYDYLRLPVVFEHTSWNVQTATELLTYASLPTSLKSWSLGRTPAQIPFSPQGGDPA